MKNPWVIFGALVALLFVGAFYIASTAGDRNNEGVEVISHIKGNPDAAVVLEEYSDFQCPACSAMFPVLADIMAEYGDQISFEYKHFPIERIHPYALQAAVAAEAAGQQGKFYEFHDLLFENQTTWSQSPTPNVFFMQYAEELGLDMDLFKRHTNASVLRDRVRAQQAEGVDRGVTGTPTLFLNGERMQYNTYEEFVTQIAIAVDPEAAAAMQAEDQPAPAEAGDIRFGI